MRNLGPQFDQLAMFHPAKDFTGDQVRNTGKFYPVDVEAYSPQGGRSSYGQMWHEKRAEAAIGGEKSLAASIKREGVRDPIEVFHHNDAEENRSPFDTSDRGYNQPETWNGHHRAIVTHDLHGAEGLVPVEHGDMYNTSWKAPELNPKMFQGSMRKR